MGSTNYTPHYELPQFIGSDKPAWLVDFNGAMSKIDAAIYEAQVAADSAQSSADAGDTSITALTNSLTALQSSVASLTTVVSNNSGNINTINSLIGNGTPTTTDQTIIGAINELHAEIGGGGEIVVDADNVEYSNLNSGLTSDNVQGAIDEVAGRFNLSRSYRATITSNYTISDQSDVRILLNSDGTVGKIYGGINITNITGGAPLSEVARLTNTGLPTLDEPYDIFLGFSIARLAQSVSSVTAVTNRQTIMRFNVDGSISFINNSTDANDLGFFDIMLPPCIYFLKDLGD